MKNCFLVLAGGGGGGGRPGGQGGQGGGSGGPAIPIVSFESENNGDGNYQFSYETGNGISAQETGQAQGSKAPKFYVPIRQKYH